MARGRADLGGDGPDVDRLRLLVEALQCRVWRGGVSRVTHGSAQNVLAVSCARDGVGDGCLRE